jgi:hypothetical protein
MSRKRELEETTENCGNLATFRPAVRAKQSLTPWGGEGKTKGKTKAESRYALLSTTPARGPETQTETRA